MHELPVTKGIFKTAMAEAEKQNAKKIKTITLKMGDNCDYVAEIIQEYFSMLAEDTIAKDCKIVANYVHTTVICKDCGREFTRQEFKDVCPYCKSEHLKLNIFKDFYIETIEIE